MRNARAPPFWAHQAAGAMMTAFLCSGRCGHTVQGTASPTRYLARSCSNDVVEFVIVLPQGLCAPGGELPPHDGLIVSPS
mmetsp:Transcript_35453/g.105952  ORF Transcript_35453/g.105952 Transcript_35453/m.105952 type:complete len:80 (+) Transcript_35453:478-717(+)